MVQFRLPKHSQIQKGKVFKQSGDALSMRTFYIYRWNAEDDKNPQMDEFTIDIKKSGPMVLDALLYIKNTIDSTPTETMARARWWASCGLSNK